MVSASTWRTIGPALIGAWLSAGCQGQLSTHQIEPRDADTSQVADSSMDLCSNGVVDSDEEGLDCGGQCPECPTASTCANVPKAGRPIVHLTFDDGPAASTLGLLDLLKQYGARATFFVRGDLARSNPAIVLRMVNEGHAIANHSSINHGAWNVDDATRTVIRDGQLAIEEIAGVVPTCARAPFGAEDPGVMAMLSDEFGLQHWKWDLDPRDCCEQSTQEVKNKLDGLPQQGNITGAEGIVVLQHDIYQFSIDALRLWLETNGDSYDFRVIDGCC